MRSMIVPFLAAGVAATGCATHKYVTREVGEVNQKVDALSTEMEKTQERVKQNEVRLDQVSSDTQSAKGAAAQAMTKAADAEKAAKGKIIYSVTLSNDKVTFPLNRAEISADAKKLVDEAIAQLKAENKGVYFEIEGHTDSTGPKEFNMKLGEDRAMAVRNYLHDEHGIALNRMQVISYGDTKPAADNNTPATRAQNRRVVLKVLE